jgi:V/A-type H+-transporting ATPase subunit K
LEKAPLNYVITEEKVMKRRIVFFVLALMMTGVVLFAQEAETGAEIEKTGTAVWKYFAAALAVGVSCIAGGIAVGQIGSAAMGAMSENPDLSGKALPYAGLAEGICLWGFLVALLILIL